MDNCNTLEAAIEFVAGLYGIPNDISLQGRAKHLARRGLLEAIGSARAGRGRKQMLHGRAFSEFCVGLSLSVLGMMPDQIVEALSSADGRREAADRLATCAAILTDARLNTPGG